MPNKCIKSIFTIFSFLLVTNVLALNVNALTLDNIGALSTGGARYVDWWYTLTNPTLRGTAEADAQVSVNIMGNIETVKADSSGNWIYNTSLDQGDYEIGLVSGSDSYYFTLHTGQNVPADLGVSTTPQSTASATTGPSEVPTTGSQQLLVITAALALTSYGYYLKKNGREKALATFEKDITK